MRSVPYTYYDHTYYYYNSGAQHQRPVAAHSKQQLTLRRLGAPLTSALRPHHRSASRRIKPCALRPLVITPRALRPRDYSAGAVGAMHSGTLRPRGGRSPVGLMTSGGHGPS